MMATLTCSAISPCLVAVLPSIFSGDPTKSRTTCISRIAPKNALSWDDRAFARSPSRPAASRLAHAAATCAAMVRRPRVYGLSSIHSVTSVLSSSLRERM